MQRARGVGRYRRLAGRAGRHPAVHMPSWIAATVTQIADGMRPETVEVSGCRFLEILIDRSSTNSPTTLSTRSSVSAPFLDPDAAAPPLWLHAFSPKR